MNSFVVVTVGGADVLLVRKWFKPIKRHGACYQTRPRLPDEVGVHEFRANGS